jgi:hypothetical protein
MIMRARFDHTDPSLCGRIDGKVKIRSGRKIAFTATRIPECGNEIREPGEQCDGSDGTLFGLDCCGADCRVKPHCRVLCEFRRGFPCEGADEICVTACGFGGTCQPRADVSCDPGPVCDCSGEVTYSSNCAAYEAGAGVSRDGVCPPWASSFASPRSRSSCHRRARDDALAPGEIVVADNGGRGFAGALTAAHRRRARAIERAAARHPDRSRDRPRRHARRRRDPSRRAGPHRRVDPRRRHGRTADGWPPSPMGVAIDDRGDVLVADLDAGSRLTSRGSLAGTGAIYRLRAAARRCCSARIAAAGTQALMAGAGSRSSTWASRCSRATLTVVDATIGVQRPIATSGHCSIRRHRADALGTLYVTDATNPQIGPGAILAVEPRSGETTLLSSGAPITDPRGIALTAAGDLVVADSAAVAVYRIGFPERTFTVLAQGDPLVRPFGIAVAP